MDEIQIGKTFISEDFPAGVDTRYEPAFEELQAEIDKLGSPTATGGINWQRVSDLAEKILSEESKDLLVGSYLGVARIYIDDLAGLTTGIHVFKDLLETFWDTMFPKKKRMRGRIAAVDWWVEKSATALEGLNLQSVEESTQASLLADCEQLNQLFLDLFPEPPAISILTRVINALPVNEGSVKPAPQQQVQTPEKRAEPAMEQPVQATAPAPQPTLLAPEPIIQQPVGSSDEAVKAIQALNENIKRAALGLVEHDPANPIGHRSLRTAIWSDLDTLPQAVDSKTIIPPPEPHVISTLQDLSSRGDWQNLAAAAENYFPQYIFWLDLQRYCTTALEHLGRSYEKSYDAVCQETAALLGRLPGLIDLQFANGLLFADEETQEWCQSLSGGENGMGMASGFTGTGGSTKETEQLNNAMQQASGLVKERKLIDAVNLLQTGIKNAHSAREAMQWRLTLVQILIGGKKAEIALAHCERLANEVQLHKLEHWDPAQALIVYTTYFHCLKKTSSKVFKERGKELLDKIAAIDSAEAIRISP